MHDIDFLPAGYREQKVEARGRAWCLGLLAAIALVVGSAEYYQYREISMLEEELADLEPRRAIADLANAKLAQIQAQLQSENSVASLLAYLGHPWPPSQVLATLFDPLPKSLVLEEIRVIREQQEKDASVTRTRRRRKSKADDELAKLPPAERDLAVLRKAYDASRVVVHLVGIAGDSNDLHRYIDRLAGDVLVERAELSSIEGGVRSRVSIAAPEVARFSLRVTLVPGYGQPGGPVQLADKMK